VTDVTASDPTRYRTIVADPPWAYDEGWPAASTSPRSAFNRGVVPLDTRKREPLPYAPMSVEAISSLPIADFAMPDAHLFLWTTNRYILDGYSVVTAWGFRPSQLLTWCKPPRGKGPGGVFASASEFVIYARRGKPQHLSRQDRTWWEWSRRGHSVKPEAFLDTVEAAVPGPYLEMFSRRSRLGWDTWGNEALNHVEIAS
jgi:N6-adenosine-specific RNA methylase IME4